MKRVEFLMPFRLTLMLLIVLGSTSGVYAQTGDGFQLPDQRSTQVHRSAGYSRPSAYDQQSNVARASFEQPVANPTEVAPAPNTIDESAFPTLAPRSDSQGSAEKSSRSQSFGPLVTTGFSLAIVLGLFAGLVWVSRRYGNGSMTQTGVPSDVLNSLGSTAIDARTRVTMLRCGNRIIVMAQTASGVHPLAEITDPVEVQRLTIACGGSASGSPVGAQPTFAETLQQVNAPRGETPAGQVKSRRLFASA